MARLNPIKKIKIFFLVIVLPLKLNLKFMRFWTGKTKFKVNLLNCVKYFLPVNSFPSIELPYLLSVSGKGLTLDGTDAHLLIYSGDIHSAKLVDTGEK